MDREFHRLCQHLALLAGLVCGPASAYAQPLPPRPQPGIPPAPKAERKPDTSPAKLPPRPEPGIPPVPKPAVNGTEEEAKVNPLVQEPKTPNELFEATVLMVGIARPDLATLYFDKLMSLNLDDEALLALRDHFGAAPIVRLTQVPELKAAAEKLLEQTNTVVARHAHDPKRALQLVLKIDGDDAEARAAAGVELRAMGALAVPGLVSVLSDPAQVKHFESTMTTLVMVGGPAVPLLLGAINGPSDNVREMVITVLGHIRAAEAARYLWYPAVSPGESDGVRAAARNALGRIFNVPDLGVDRIASQGTVNRLTKLSSQHYRRDFPWATDSQGRVTLWRWNDDQKTVVPVQYTPDEASDLTGLAFAKQALALAPDLRKVQVLYLSQALAADVRVAGLDGPLPIGPGTAHDLALSVGPEVMLDVLNEALTASRPATGVAALRVLQQIGTRAQMAGTDGKRSPILAALDYPDPRVQFAAAVTILQFDPKADFRGSTRVVDILTRAASAGARPHVVVGEISVGRGAQIGGFLRDMGYEPIVTLSGREAFRAAAERGDVELVVLHPNLIRWALSETLANLRADSRTAGMPVVIHGPGELESKMKIHLRNLKLVSFASMGLLTEDFERQVQPVLDQVKNPPMSDAVRAEQRREALGWLAHIANGRRMKVFDISNAEQVLVDSLADAKLAPTALEALSELPTQSVQRRMAELALDVQAPVELRQSAALRLAFHIQRFGLLLAKSSIDALHVAWKDEKLPAELRTALGGVIGSLKPDSTLVGKRLQAFPAAE